MDKRSFKANVIDIILDAIKAHCNVSRHFETSMTSKENGFYFKFYRYGQELQIMVFPNGHISIKVRECCHADQVSAYYHFRKDDDHDALLSIIRQDLDLLIRDYYSGMDYNALADAHITFTLIRKEENWLDTYQKLRSLA